MNIHALFTLLALAVLPAEPPSAPLPVKGHVLVLENDRVLQGDIERVGDQFCIRRAGGEMWVPASQTRCLCNDMAQAYLFLKQNSNTSDPDEHLRLAQWCHLQNLPAQALMEATEAVRLRPRHTESVLLLRGLQRTSNQIAVARPPRQVPPEVEPPAENLPFNADALGLFVSRVQPILMNTCASCHASNRSGSFKLTRASAGLVGSRKVTQRNLIAVLGELDRNRPKDSRFLQRALSIHGHAEKPPLQSRETPAYQALESWVLLATAGLGETKPGQPEPAVAVKEAETRPDALAPATVPITSLPSEKPASKKPASQTSKPFALPAQPAPAESFGDNRKPQAPSDEFDPGIFNQQMGK